MGARNCQIVRITGDKLFLHDNADSLVIFRENGIQVVIRKESWKDGDFALWCPPDSIVPERAEWTWAVGRVKVSKLRGVVSDGLFLPIGADEAEAATKDGHINEWFGIGHYEPEEKGGINGLNNGEDEKSPRGYYPKYDVDGAAKLSKYLDGVDVSISEKLHGQNICVVYRDDTFHVRSRSFWKKDQPNSIFWESARNTNGLLEMVRAYPGYAFYGEQIGHNKHFKYGLDKPKVYLFDIWDLNTNKWLDVAEFSGIVGDLAAPHDYTGVFSEQVARQLAESPGHLQNLREGVVIKPLKEMVSPKGDRLLIKYINPAYFEKS